MNIGLEGHYDIDIVCPLRRNLILLFVVSKTTKELVLRWKDDGAPIDISDEVKMPQFEIFKIVDTRCQETMHIGKILQQFTMFIM